VILQGDALTRLRELPTGTVQCCVTSPPYYGLRDYGTDVWEGGDPDCDHRMQSRGNPDAAAKYVTKSTLGGGNNTQQHQQEPSYGQVCGKCGARRVSPWTGGDQDCDHSIAHTRTVGNAPSAKSTLTTNNGRGPQPGDKFHADQRREVATDCPCGAVRTDGQLGLEATPDEYVTRLVAVFREVRRVLRADGTLWLNLGDSYASNMTAGTKEFRNPAFNINRPSRAATKTAAKTVPEGCKAKDLLGIPWMVAFALRDDGWYLRSDIIWAKPNPMPESVTDRPTQAHEHIFLLTKAQRYFYDADAIREPHQWAHVGEMRLGERSKNGGSIEAPVEGKGNTTGSFRAFAEGGRNKRNVWEIATQPFPQAHFATFPTKLVEPCVFAGTSPKACGECGAPWGRVTEIERRLEGNSARAGKTAAEIAGSGKWTPQQLNGNANLKAGPVVDVRTLGWEPSCDHQDDSGRCVVLDPFAGSGTVGAVSVLYGREFIGIELNPDYCEMAEQRIMVEGRGGRLRPPPEQIDGQMSLLPST
jgi:DNA modification methylase